MAGNTRTEKAMAIAEKDASIRDRFHYHKPTPTHEIVFSEATDAIDQLVEFVLTIPDSQERAVALTQLGLTRMLINASIIARSPESIMDYRRERGS